MKKLSYWGENLRLIAILLAVWFAISFGCGVLLVDVLNRDSRWADSSWASGSRSRAACTGSWR